MSGLCQLEAPKKRACFPKSVRLLKSKDFRFKNYKKIKNTYFHILVEENGAGRLGISIAKKVLKRAVWRNRVKRLIKEAFRTEHNRLKTKNIHVIAQPELINEWDKFNLENVKEMLTKIGS